MSIDNDAMKTVAEDIAEDKAFKEGLSDMADTESVQEPIGFPTIDFSFLKARTGEGAIEDYIEHPLNYKKSKGIAQILRGATGLLGALDLAIVDIGLGTIQAIKESRGYRYDTGQ